MACMADTVASLQVRSRHEKKGNSVRVDRTTRGILESHAERRTCPRCTRG